jgi:hypothetical protein
MVAALLGDQAGQIGLVGLGTFDRPAPDIAEQRFDRIRGLGHGVVELVGGVAIVAQQSGLFRAQRDDLEISVELSVSPPLAPRAVQALKAVSRRSRRELEVRKGSMIERDRVTANLPMWPQLLGDGGHGGAQIVRQSVEIGRPQAAEANPFVGQHILAEAGSEASEGFVDLPPAASARLDRGRRPT